MSGAAAAAAVGAQSAPELTSQYAVDDEIHRRVGRHRQVADVEVVVVRLHTYV